MLLTHTIMLLRHRNYTRPVHRILFFLSHPIVLANAIATADPSPEQTTSRVITLRTVSVTQSGTALGESGAREAEIS